MDTLRNEYRKAQFDLFRKQQAERRARQAAEAATFSLAGLPAPEPLGAISEPAPAPVSAPMSAAEPTAISVSPPPDDAGLAPQTSAGSELAPIAAGGGGGLASPTNPLLAAGRRSVSASRNRRRSI
jgi:hypothetical protein